MTIIRGVSRLPKSASSLNSSLNSLSQIYGLFKCDGKLMFQLDKNALNRSLEAEGIEKYADTVTSVLEEAGKELTNELEYRVGEEYFEKSNVREASLNYFFGAVSFLFALTAWPGTSKKDA